MKAITEGYVMAKSLIVFRERMSCTDGAQYRFLGELLQMIGDFANELRADWRTSGIPPEWSQWMNTKYTEKLNAFAQDAYDGDQVKREFLKLLFPNHKIIFDVNEEN